MKTSVSWGAVKAARRVSNDEGLASMGGRLTGRAVAAIPTAPAGASVSQHLPQWFHWASQKPCMRSHTCSLVLTRAGSSGCFGELTDSLKNLLSDTILCALNGVIAYRVNVGWVICDVNFSYWLIKTIHSAVVCLLRLLIMHYGFYNYIRFKASQTSSYWHEIRMAYIYTHQTTSQKSGHTVFSFVLLLSIL